MVNEGCASEPCGLWAAHPGCTEGVNDRRSRNFLLSSSHCLRRPRQQKHNSHAHRHLRTYTRTCTATRKPQLPPPPPPPIPVRSCTIIATVIHRCWILLASHKTWYAWFVLSARSVISFSFSFIFSSWATRSISLLYESADTQRDFQDDYMPPCHGVERGVGGGLKEPTRQPKSRVKLGWKHLFE